MGHKEIDNPLQKLAELLTDPRELLVDIFEQLDELKIDTSEMHLDHIGYRSGSSAEYVALCQALTVNGLADLEAENEVRGRRIAVFTLHQPLRFRGFIIDGLEIIEPKVGDTRQFNHPLEHAEFVLIYQSLEEFIEENPQVPFDLTDIHRERNPEVRLKLSSGRSVGFHTLVLATYVGWE